MVLEYKIDLLLVQFMHDKAYYASYIKTTTLCLNIKE